MSFSCFVPDQRGARLTGHQAASNRLVRYSRLPPLVGDTNGKGVKAMAKTTISSSIEEKLEAIIKVIKKEFPELAPSSQAEILQRIVTLDVS